MFPCALGLELPSVMLTRCSKRTSLDNFGSPKIIEETLCAAIRGTKVAAAAHS